MPRALITLLALAGGMVMSTALTHAQTLHDLTLGWDFDWHFTLPDGHPADTVMPRGFRLAEQDASGWRLVVEIGPDPAGWSWQSISYSTIHTI